MRLSLARWTLALLLTSLLLAGCGRLSFGVRSAPTPTPVTPSAFGVEVSGLSVETAGFETAGTYWVRIAGLWWPDVEPEEGARNWETQASFEAEMRAAVALGQRAILIVRGTPAWAQAVPGSQCSAIRPDKLDAFARFVGDLVGRYGTDPYRIRYYEFGNEPDLSPHLVEADSLTGCWGDEADTYYGGGAYAEMLRRAYPAVKQVLPDAQVLIGGLLLDCDPRLRGACRDDRPPQFLEGILRAGGGDYFDGVSFHAYDYYNGHAGQYFNPNWHSSWDSTGPVLLAKAAFIASLLRQYSVNGKYSLATEVALLCGAWSDPPSGPGCQAAFELTKAYYLAQAYAGALEAGLPATLWYSRAGWRNSILFNDDRSPRPAYRALQVSRDRLGRAEPAGELEAADVGGEARVAGYKFLRDGLPVWLLWSRDGRRHGVALAGQPDSVSDVFGVPVPFGSSLEVGVVPDYVEWPQ